MTTLLNWSDGMKTNVKIALLQIASLSGLYMWLGHYHPITGLDRVLIGLVVIIWVVSNEFRE